jgi:hypothetical protein
MEPEGSLPSSQELSTCTYPEPDQSSPKKIIDHINIIHISNANIFPVFEYLQTVEIVSHTSGLTLHYCTFCLNLGFFQAASQKVCAFLQIYKSSCLGMHKIVASKILFKELFFPFQRMWNLCSFTMHQVIDIFQQRSILT